MLRFIIIELLLLLILWVHLCFLLFYLYQ